MRIIGSLADAADLPRDHVAIVPGSHDVNRQACAAYFLRQAAEEATPVPPYWPKWENYATALNHFYQNSSNPSFTPDEPWTLFEIPDMSTVIAGLNSTIPESHLESGYYGAIDDDQLRWFAARLTEYKRRGWLRLGAIHHDVSPDSPDGKGILADLAEVDRNLGSSGLISLFISGHRRELEVGTLPSGLAVVYPGRDVFADEPIPRQLLSQYQIIKLQASGFTRYARRYDPDAQCWISDTRISSTGSDQGQSYSFSFPELAVRSAIDERKLRDDESSVFNRPGIGAPTLSEEFFDRVVEATRVSLPSASISTRLESCYLRVSIPLDGGGCEQWPVGVLTKGVSAEAVTDFIERVHSLFRAADPQVRSQLVYFGKPAPESLVTKAREAGVRLRSFVDYSGLIDLQSFERAQSNRLAGDVIYPESGYVTQRFRVLDEGPDIPIHENLLGQLIEWLSVDGPRFIMLLGDSGRGKTYLLRQLTRRLPEKLPMILPILLELRSLEKAPTLDALLAQHLYRHQVEGITEAKLRFIISSGRVVILCDGFDELELRVGYENAADYLQTLLGAVTDRAKVVVSSRAQHFRSDAQVRTALGVHIASNSTSRIASIEDFTEEQILEVLTTLYNGDQVTANARFQLLSNVPELSGLSRNPRMLSFIAGLPDQDLRGIEQALGQLSGAGLYEALVNRWLAREQERHLHPGGLAPLEVDERREACTDLALRLWASGEPTFPISDLSLAVARTLTGLLDRGYTAEEAAQEVGSGTLLVRAEEGEFSFVHRSIMEWLVARATANDLSSGGTPAVLESGRFSGLMIRFLCDLAGHDTARQWAASVLREPGSNEAAKQNALAINGRLEVAVRKQLAGVDLRGQDLTRWDLGGADLRSATLRGMQIVHANFRGADLRGADFSGARLTACDLGGVDARGSVWDRAALVGVSGLRGLHGRQELVSAAVVGRDRAEPMVGLGGPALAVAVSPDGALAAVGRRGGIELDDLATGQTVRVLSGHTGHVWGLAFSSRRGLLATGSTDGSARVWEITTGLVKQLLEGHAGPVWDVAFSPDEKLIATACHDHTVRVWEVDTGKMQLTLTGHEGPVWGVAFSPDGTLIATASHDRTGRIWDSARGNTVKILRGHSDWVRAIAFSPDGTLIATASNDHTVRVWDVEGGVVRTTLTGHKGLVRSVSFSPDGTLIATASHDHTARLWDTSTGQVRNTLTSHTQAVNAVAFSPDGALIATASDDGVVRIQDVSSEAVRMSFAGRAGWIWDVALTGSATVIAVASQDGNLSIWNLATKHRVGTFPAIDSPIAGAVLSPDGASLAVSLRDDSTSVWRAGQINKVLNGYGGTVRASSFSINGRWVAAGSDNATARIWDAATGEIRATMAGHTQPVNTVAFSPDGTLAATGSDDATARIWDAATGELRAVLTGHSRPVNGVAFSPDGHFLVTGSDDATALIWDARDYRLLRTLSGHLDWVHAVAFSASGELVATASADATARIWDAVSGTVRFTLSGHTAAVRKVTFSPQNGLLATAADDGSVRIWATPEGRLIEQIFPLINGGYASLHQDGSYSLGADVSDSSLWWAVKLCRFSPGEIDRYDSRIRKSIPKS
jgi:WD40 repeat protein